MEAETKETVSPRPERDIQKLVDGTATAIAVQVQYGTETQVCLRPPPRIRIPIEERVHRLVRAAPVPVPLHSGAHLFLSHPSCGSIYGYVISLEELYTRSRILMGLAKSSALSCSHTTLL